MKTLDPLNIQAVKVDSDIPDVPAYKYVCNVEGVEKTFWNADKALDFSLDYRDGIIDKDGNKIE